MMRTSQGYVTLPVDRVAVRLALRPTRSWDGVLEAVQRWVDRHGRRHGVVVGKVRLGAGGARGALVGNQEERPLHYQRWLRRLAEVEASRPGGWRRAVGLYPLKDSAASSLAVLQPVRVIFVARAVPVYSDDERRQVEALRDYWDNERTSVVYLFTPEAVNLTR